MYMYRSHSLILLHYTEEEDIQQKGTNFKQEYM